MGWRERRCWCAFQKHLHTDGEKKNKEGLGENKNTYASHLGKVLPKVKTEAASRTRLILLLEFGAVIALRAGKPTVTLPVSAQQVVLFQVSKLIRMERDNSAKPKPWMAKGFQSPLWAPSEPYRTRWGCWVADKLCHTRLWTQRVQQKTRNIIWIPKFQLPLPTTCFSLTFNNNYCFSLKFNKISTVCHKYR